MPQLLFTICLLFISTPLFSQYNYWIRFTDKGDLTQIEQQSLLSQRAFQNRARQQIPITDSDYPVNPQYLSQLKALDIPLSYPSKWLNAVGSQLKASQIDQVLALPFVRDIYPIAQKMETAAILDDCPEEPFIDMPLRQLEMVGIDVLHEHGYSGQGVLIAVFDNGFRGVDTLGAFNHLYAEDRIIATKDFVEGDIDVYGTCNHCQHGTYVFSILAAKQPGTLIGSAPDADYILLRTENDASETQQEELNWIAAAEFADSLGAQIFTTSLGYYSFDDGIGDYSYEDLNGNTALISVAAGMAAEKGIIVVNSVGNRGDRGVSAPADGHNVIAIGSVDQCEEYSGFSSQGPLSDGRLKPDLTAMGQQTYFLQPNGIIRRGNGTSFSTPIVTGLIANILQAFPNTSREKMYESLIQSADRYEMPDNLHGYGIPDGANMVYILGGTLNHEALNEDPFAQGDFLAFPNPSQGGFQITLLPDTATYRFQLEILDLSGRKVWEDQWDYNAIKSPLYLKSGALAPGFYTLRAMDTENDHRVYSQKLIIIP